MGEAVFNESCTELGVFEVELVLVRADVAWAVWDDVGEDLVGQIVVLLKELKVRYILWVYDKS